MKLQSRVVLVTGGSAGLGAAVARKFVAEGADIAINYAFSRDRAQQFRDGLAKEYPERKIILLQGDVSKSAVCMDLVAQTVQQLGRLDCVVSNAGWTKAADWKDLDALTEEEWDRTYAMNVKAHLFLFQAAKPHFNGNAEGGNMIITTSIAGVKTTGSSLAYSVSKHGAIALARGLALHQGPKCRVNTVAPGLLETEWAVKQFGTERISALKQAAPLKMNASVEDCADAFLLLAGSRSITGETIVIDAGQSLR